MIDRDELAARVLCALVTKDGVNGYGSASDAVRAADDLLLALTPAVPPPAPTPAPEAKRPEWVRYKGPEGMYQHRRVVRWVDNRPVVDCGYYEHEHGDDEWEPCSPPTPTPDVAAAERAVVEAAGLWRYGQAESSRRLEEAIDALRAARAASKGGA